MGRLWATRELSVGCPWYPWRVREVSVGREWVVRGVSIDFHGANVLCPTSVRGVSCGVCGEPMGCPRAARGPHMGRSWVTWRLSVGS